MYPIYLFDIDTNENPSQPPCKKRKFLTNQDREAIGKFLLKSTQYGILLSGTTNKLASMYGVCQRVIQRIWHQLRETREASHRKTQNCGRKGVKLTD